ncbi:MAG: hypothetical protein ABSA52_16910 [Candidatus Binatia bacterium]|jgi:hypothetical protein
MSCVKGQEGQFSTPIHSQAIERAITTRDTLEKVSREKAALGSYGSEEVACCHPDDLHG